MDSIRFVRKITTSVESVEERAAPSFEDGIRKEFLPLLENAGNFPKVRENSVSVEFFRPFPVSPETMANLPADAEMLRIVAEETTEFEDSEKSVTKSGFRLSVRVLVDEDDADWKFSSGKWVVAGTPENFEAGERGFEKLVAKISSMVSRRA